MAEVDLDISVDQESPVPLYQQISEQIRRKIESRQLMPGTLLPTSHQLRAQLQINYKTAHQAMALLAKEGYVTRQARRGTVVKGIPRRGVAAIYTYMDLVSQEGKHEYYRLLTGYLGRQLENIGRVYRMYLGSEVPDSTSTASDDLLRHISGGTLCAALLVNAPYPWQDEVIEQGRAMNIPVISLTGSVPAEYSVVIDLVGYVRAAAEYLRRQGKTRVGVIYNSSSSSFREPGTVDRILAGAGLAANPSWIIGRVETEQGGYDAASRLPISELDGLIVEDDIMALGVDRRLSELRVRVPQDLLVTTLWVHRSRLQLLLPFEGFEIDAARQARLSIRLMQDAITGERIMEPHQKVAVMHHPAAAANDEEFAHRPPAANLTPI